MLVLNYLLKREIRAVDFNVGWREMANNTSPETVYIRLPEVLKILGISRSTFYAGIKSGKYPSPVKIGKRVSAWKIEEV